MHCFVCQSPVDAGESWCAVCGAATQQSPDPDSERKFVTILRADLVHSTDLVAELDPEEALSRLEPALVAMRAAVRQFGGIVSKELGDGLTAVFGAPMADDNHAPLACHAALDLVRRVAGLGDRGLQVRVGLHSGFAVTYMVASEFSKVYEIGGAAGHLAARLESAAEPGQIYASEACQKLSEGDIRFEYLGRIPLKGFAGAIPVYRVTGASDLSSWRTRKTRSVSRFVDRSEELALLRQAAAGIGAGGRTVCLTGEPGIGKSRLVHEFAEELETEGWQLIEAECSPNLRGSPFAALKNLLRSIVDAAAPRERPGEVADPREGLSPIMRSAVDAVLDLPISDDLWNQLEPQARGQAITDASRAIVENLARRRRTVLLIEDLHWADRASNAVMAALASIKTAPLLIIVTSRPNGVPGWIGQSGAESLTLRPLDESSGREMLDAILGPSSTMLDLKGRIIRHTANVPLFVEEVCRRLKETDVVQGQWGDLTLVAPVEQLGIPNSLQGVIAARLDRLRKEERAIMQIAAALGARAPVAALREVAAMPEMLLERSLGALDRAELLIKAPGDAVDCVEFRHEMVCQVTYDSMVERTREKVHALILSALENTGPAAEPDQLCHHATRAKNWEKAFAYGRDVARKGVARSAFADATTYFEIAMDALDKTPISRARETEAIDLRIEARMAFMGSGRVADWLELGKEAERRAGTIDDIGRRVAAMAVTSAAQNFYGTPPDAIATGEEVVRLAEQWGDPGWLNLAEYGLGQAYSMAGRHREAEHMIGRACARLMGPEPSAPIGTTPRYLLLMCHTMKSLAHAALGEFDVADLLQERAQRIADESNRPFDRVAAAYSGGTLALARGNPAAAAIILDEAFALAQQHGVGLFVPAIACQRGMAYLEQDRIDAAREILAGAREAAASVGFKLMELRASIYLALALSRAGDAQAALTILRGARNTATQQGFSGLEAEALLCEAMIRPAANEDDRVTIIRCLQASIAIAARNDAKPLLRKAEAALSAMLANGRDDESSPW